MKQGWRKWSSNEDRLAYTRAYIYSVCVCVYAYLEDFKLFREVRSFVEKKYFGSGEWLFNMCIILFSLSPYMYVCIRTIFALEDQICEDVFYYLFLYLLV